VSVPFDLHPLWDWFRVLYETTGIKLTIFYDAFDRARFFNSFLTSVRLMGVCLVASVAIGVVGAWIQGSRLRVLRQITQGYIQFFRNTPPLVQLYFFYFALGSYLKVTGPTGLAVPLVGNFTWAAICLSMYAGSFNVEIFRAGIEAVPRQTVEAAEALGYSRLRAYVYIILPLAFRISLPALNNNLVNLVKTTTISYAIAVPEMLYVANQIWSDEVNVPEMMNVLLVIYVGLVGILVWAMGRWERATRVPGWGVA
jgi:polar amino acid transport system permease protein